MPCILIPNQMVQLAWHKGNCFWLKVGKRQYSHKSAKRPIRNDTVKLGFHIPMVSKRPALFMIQQTLLAFFSIHQKPEVLNYPVTIKV